MPLHSANVVDKTGRVQKNNDEPNELSSRFERSHLLGMDPWDPDPDTDQIRFWTRVAGHEEWVVEATFANASQIPTLHSILITPLARWTPADGLDTNVVRSVKLDDLQRQVSAKIHTKDMIAVLSRTDSVDAPTARPSSSATRCTRRSLLRALGEAKCGRTQAP